jgi:hypothetical protein
MHRYDDWRVHTHLFTTGLSTAERVASVVVIQEDIVPSTASSLPIEHPVPACKTHTGTVMKARMSETQHG